MLKNCKLLAFFFSADWCPPCKGFIPHLIDLFDYANQREEPSADIATVRPFEIIYVSSDNKEEQMHQHLKTVGNWLYLAFDDPRAKLIAAHFNVKGVP